MKTKISIISNIKRWDGIYNVYDVRLLTFNYALERHITLNGTKSIIGTGVYRSVNLILFIHFMRWRNSCSRGRLMFHYMRHVAQRSRIKIMLKLNYNHVQNTELNSMTINFILFASIYNRKWSIIGRIL